MQEAVLTGSLLEAFLDEAEARIDDETGDVPDDSRAAVLRAMLEGNPGCADNMGTLGRLFRLWLQAGQPVRALQLLDTHRPVLLAAIADEERPAAEVQFAFWRIEATQGIEGSGDLLDIALADTAQLLKELPETLHWSNAWGYLADLAQGAGDYALQRQCLRARHACHIFQPDRANYRAWDDAGLACRLGSSYAAAGQAAEAAREARASIDILSKATPEQDVSYDDWLRLGGSLLPFAPEVIGEVRERTRAKLPADLSPALRRAVEVRLARLEAKALYQRGDLEAALVSGWQGRFLLSDDVDDSFSAQMLDWLLEAGCEHEATQLAFESAFAERPVSATHACQVAMRRMRDPTVRDPYWPLTLAFAATTTELSWVAGDEDLDDYFARHLALALEWAPDCQAASVVFYS